VLNTECACARQWGRERYRCRHPWLPELDCLADADGDAAVVEIPEGLPGDRVPYGAMELEIDNAHGADRVRRGRGDRGEPTVGAEQHRAETPRFEAVERRAAGLSGRNVPKEDPVPVCSRQRGPIRALTDRRAWQRGVGGGVRHDVPYIGLPGVLDGEQVTTRREERPGRER